MTRLSDYHTHSRFCDGRGEPEQYARVASERGMACLGFSAHAPLPFETGWNMKSPDAADYLRACKRARDRYEGRIEVSIGLEVDFIPGVISPSAPAIDGQRPDYTIGSVHFLGRLRDGTYWTVDGPTRELTAGVEQSYGGDYQAAVEEYYRRLREMIATDPPDILGHFDLIKKNNEGLFDESTSWYRRAVEETVEALSGSSVVVEVNTGGVTRGFRDDFYPSPWIVEALQVRDIRVTVSSDSHSPDHLCNYFPRAFDQLRQARHQSYWVLEGRRWSPAEIPGREELS